MNSIMPKIGSHLVLLCLLPIVLRKISIVHFFYELLLGMKNEKKEKKNLTKTGKQLQLPNKVPVKANAMFVGIKRVLSTGCWKETKPPLQTLQHDNARIHTANFAKKVIQELGCDFIPHHPYSADWHPQIYTFSAQFPFNNE